MFTLPSGKNKGFTIIEAIVAVVILSIVGIGIARFFLNATQSATQVRRMTKASSLFDMVFEQFTAKAGVNFHTLPNFTGSAQQFFGTADNMNMDGMTIVTLAEYAPDRSSCNMKVTLKWKDGGQEKELSRSKLFLPQNTRPAGANVTVTATYNGAGIPNLTVSAPSVYGGMTTVVTDSSGTALVPSVLPGTDIPIKISSLPADYDAGPTASHVLGYYVLVNGNYLTSVTLPWQVDVAHTDPIVVTDFRPAGKITGHFINDDDPAVVAGQKVTLGTATVALAYKGGVFNRCGIDITNCYVLTDSSGTYTFYNVIPTAGKLHADGSAGSHPNIQPGAPTFAYGTCNLTPYPFVLDDWDQAVHRTLRVDLHVRRRGWVTVTPTYSGSPLPDTMVEIRYPPNRFYIYEHHYNALTNPSGTVTFYNVLVTNSDYYSLTGDTAPPPDTGYFGSRWWSCPGGCIGRRNDVDLPMDVGFRFVGQLRDMVANPVANVNGLRVSLPSITAVTMTDASGNFGFPRFSPLAAGFPYSGNPAVPSNVQWFISNTALWLPITVNGRTVDRQTGQPAAHVSLLKGATEVIQSDANGNFTASNFSYTAPYYAHKVYCVAADATCYPTASQTSPTPTAMPIDTSKTRVIIKEAAGDGWSLGYEDYVATLASGQTVNSVQLTALLTAYQVQGVVTNALTGLPVAGIRIRDTKTGDTEATTGADGSYFGLFSVIGRTSTNPGKVTLDIVAQTVGGQTYPAVPPASVNVPAVNPDPTIPLMLNLTFQSIGSDI